MDSLFKQQLIQEHDTLENIYDDNNRNVQCAYEVAFYLEYGLLPDDRAVIDSIEHVDGGLLYIHNELH